MNITNLIAAMYQRATPLRRMGTGTIRVVIATPDGDREVARVEADKTGPVVRLIPTKE
jgi:hypothetical protein